VSVPPLQLAEMESTVSFLVQVLVQVEPTVVVSEYVPAVETVMQLVVAPPGDHLYTSMPAGPHQTVLLPWQMVSCPEISQLGLPTLRSFVQVTEQVPMEVVRE